MSLEDELIKILLLAGRPLKARAIAAILGNEMQIFAHKREINPTLYRMLSAGRVRRDAEFRWCVGHGVSQSPAMAEESLDAQTLVDRISPPAAPKKEPNKKYDLVKPPVRNYGRFQTGEDVRPYLRHCTWCSAEILQGEPALVVYGVGGRCPRFCSEDCFQGWESIYWQRLALSHLGLSREELKVEQRYLRHQKYFRQFR